MNCILTGRTVVYSHHKSSIGYTLNIAGKTVQIFICHGCQDRIKLEPRYHHIISGLIVNGKWPQRSFLISEKCDNPDIPHDAVSIILPDFIETLSYPRTPKEKMDNFFLNLFKIQKSDGESNQIFLSLRKKERWKIL